MTEGALTREVALAELRQWLDHPGNRGNQIERARQQLADYAQLPVRRFSNLHAERAAGYVRWPATHSLGTVGRWIEAEAVAGYFAAGLPPFAAWRRAAAWRYTGLALQLARHASGDIADPRVLGDEAARVLFLLGAIGDREHAERLARRMLALRGAGFLQDAGSKCAPFAFSLAEHWLTPERARPVAAFFQAGAVDTSGACAAYQALIDGLRSPAPAAPRDALLAACRAHALETRACADEETFDFDFPHEALVPFELLCFVQIRRWLGHATACPGHPLLDLPEDFRVQDARMDPDDPLLEQVMTRARKALPGLEAWLAPLLP